MNKGIVFISVFLSIPFLCFAQESTEESSHSYISKVKTVINGDTLELENGERVRLIGIDCPEMDTEEGKRTYEFTKELVEGKYVSLELDVQQRDKYGRLLAYVYIIRIMSSYEPYYTETAAYKEFERNGVYFRDFLNALIINDGYAQPMTIPPNVKYAELFQKLYQEARENKRGLWKGLREELHNLSECEKAGGKLKKIKECNGSESEWCIISEREECYADQVENGRCTVGEYSQERKAIVGITPRVLCDNWQ